MKYEQPYGAAADAPYVNGDPSIGQAGSIPPAASIEHPQREIVNVISKAGATPTDASLVQLAQAIQSGQLIYAEDTGTANNYSVALSQIPSTILPGFMIVMKPGNSNNGPSVVTVNGAASKDIKRRGGSDLIEGDILADVLTALLYTGTHYELAWQTANGPVYLTAPSVYFVNGSTGNDLYDGRSATFTSGTNGPFATIQKACNQIPLYNLNGFNLTINVADGAYAAFTVPRINGSGIVSIIGNVASPGNVTVTGTNKSAVSLGNLYGDLIITGIETTCSGVLAGDPIANYAMIGPGKLSLGNVNFGACVGAHIYVSLNAQVTNSANAVDWRIKGGATGNALANGSFVFAQAGGTFLNNALGGPDVIINNSLTLAGAFVYARHNSFIQFVYASLTLGAFTVTGQRYNVDQNSQIVSGTGSATYFPGTVAGAAGGSGGFYS